MKAVVSGNDADKKFSDVSGVSQARDLSLYGSDGTKIDTEAAAKTLVTGSPTDIQFTIRSGDSGENTHLSVTMSIICVKKLDGSCPSATN